MEPLRPERPFGVLSNWEDSVPVGRVPISERPIREFGNRSLVPTRVRKTGFVPRIGVGVEANSNVFVTSTDHKSDVTVWASPGLNYVGESARGRIEADASLESTAYADNTDLSSAAEAWTGFLYGSYALSNRVTAEFLDSVLNFQDPSGDLLSSIRSVRAETTQNFAEGALEYRLDAASDLRVRVANFLHQSDDPLSIDNAMSDLEVALARQLGPRDLLRGQYQLRHLGFDGTPDAVYHIIAGEAEHQFHERAAVRCRLGIAVPTSGVPDHPEFVGRVSASLTAWRVTLELSAEHDLVSGGGIGDVLRARTEAARADWKVAPGLSIVAALEHARFDSVGPSDLGVDVLQPRLAALWSFRPGFALAMRVRYLQRDAHIVSGFVEGTLGDLTLVASF